MAANPLWSRWRLSRVLAERWQWYSASGELKDMAARTLLLKLHRRQLIALPQRRRAPVRRGPLLSPELFDSVVPEPISADLSSLLPLKVQVVGPKHPDYHCFQRYLVQHHYLSYRGPVGENLGYLIRSCAGGGSGVSALWGGGLAVRCPRSVDWLVGPATGRRLALHRQQQSILSFALGECAPSGQPHSLTYRPADRCRLARALSSASLPAGDLRAARSFPGHLLSGGQLDPGGPNQRTNAPE